jgi:hypothetical protein
MSQLIKLLSVAFLAIFLSGVGKAAETPPSKEAPKASVNNPRPEKDHQGEETEGAKFVGNISPSTTSSARCRPGPTARNLQPRTPPKMH